MVRVKFVQASPLSRPSLFSTTAAYSNSSLNHDLAASQADVARVRSEEYLMPNPVLEDYKRQLMDIEQKAKRERDARDGHRYKRDRLVGRMIQNGVIMPVGGHLRGDDEHLEVQKQDILLEMHEKTRLWVLSSGGGGSEVNEEIAAKEVDVRAGERNRIFQDYWTQLKTAGEHGDSFIKEEMAGNLLVEMEETDDDEVKMEDSSFFDPVNFLDRTTADHSLQDYPTQFTYLENRLRGQQDQDQQDPNIQIKQQPQSSVLQQEQVPPSLPIRGKEGVSTHQLLISFEGSPTNTPEFEADKKKWLSRLQQQERPVFQPSLSGGVRPTPSSELKLGELHSFQGEHSLSPSTDQLRLRKPYSDIEKANMKYEYTEDSKLSPRISTVRHQQLLHPQKPPPDQKFQGLSTFVSQPSSTSYYEEETRCARYPSMAELPETYIIQGLPDGLNHALTNEEKVKLLAWRREHADVSPSAGTGSNVAMAVALKKSPSRTALDDYQSQLNNLDVRNEAQN